MRTGAAVLGIVGGAIALIIGVVSFFVADLGATLGIEGAVIRQVLAIGLPILALIGGGVAPRSGIAGGILMALSAIGIFIILEIGVFSLITGIPIAIGALLALIGAATSNTARA